VLGSIRKVLRWVGIENEHGLFSWRAMLIAIGLSAFLSDSNPYSAGLLAAALVAHFIEGHRSQQRTRIAMQTADHQAYTRMQCEKDVAVKMGDVEIAKAKIGADEGLEGVRKQLADLREKVKLLSTPEQMEKLERFQQLVKTRLGGSK
jgi:hypothetical protein